jgi:hypothetical protein
VGEEDRKFGLGVWIRICIGSLDWNLYWEFGLEFVLGVWIVVLDREFGLEFG